MEIYPDFSDACVRARAIRARSFEGDLIDVKQRGGDSSRFQAVRFGLLNLAPDEYKDKTTTESTLTITLASLIQDSMKLVNAPEPVTIEGESVKPGE